MARRIKVVCTGGDKKAHTQHIFNTVTVTADGVDFTVLRKAKANDLAGHTVDGIALPSYVVKLDYNPRYGAHGWRWVCPVPTCREDQQWDDEASVRQWLMSCDDRVADISHRVTPKR
jgi:hypothetical protein